MMIITCVRCPWSAEAPGLYQILSCMMNDEEEYGVLPYKYSHVYSKVTAMEPLRRCLGEVTWEDVTL